MAGFEAPIVNQQLAVRMHGLTPNSVRIARNPDNRRNLDHFIDTCLTPQHLVDGEDAYNYGYFSGITQSGTMVHVRSHSAIEEGIVDDNRYFTVAIGSLDHPGINFFTMTTVDQRRAYDGTTEVDILVGLSYAEETPILQLVSDETQSEAERLEADLERYLEADAATHSLAVLSIRSNVWTFQHGGGRQERLRDLIEVRRQIELATARGLAGAAFTAGVVGVSAEYDYGHLEQKVVV